MRPLTGFEVKGFASVLIGGQWGSEGKGCAAAWAAYELAKEGRAFDIVTTNAAAQAGHTSIHKGRRRVVFHLPTASLIAQDELGSGKAGTVYLNAGAIIDPVGFEKELNDNPFNGPLFIHPYAAVITDECKEAEGRADSGQTKIASTRKGVGEALSRKVLRTGMVAKDHPFLAKFTKGVVDLNRQLRVGNSVLVEVPQGVSLSLNHSGFYPYTTSRDCTPNQGLSDANIHPQFYNGTMVTLRTFPIRVGNIVEDGATLGTSGPHFYDQRETSWEELGVEAEITTVTKRVRRVFTFSMQQLVETFNICDPDYVFLTFCNYVKEKPMFDQIVASIQSASKVLMQPPPKVIYQWGPTTEDAGEHYVVT